jgi:hypothetical protein
MVLSNGVPQIFQHVLLDMPGLTFFTTYALLVLFWAEIYYQVPERTYIFLYFVINVIGLVDLRCYSLGTCNVD